MLTVSHWVSSVNNLGPGARTCIWFTGCSKVCDGCCSPELKCKEAGKEYAPLEMAVLVNSLLLISGDQGVTISGGDPLEQDIDDFCEFLSYLEADDILLYTGYTYKELMDSGIYERICNDVTAIICGRYIRSFDDGNPLIGSSNQELICSDHNCKGSYIEYMNLRKRQPEYYIRNNALVFTGLPVKEGD